MTVILVAVGSSTTPKLAIFKTSTFHQLQLMFICTPKSDISTTLFHVDHLQIDMCLHCISEGDGRITCFERHTYKLLVSENKRFIKILNRSRL